MSAVESVPDADSTPIGTSSDSPADQPTAASGVTGLPSTGAGEAHAIGSQIMALMAVVSVALIATGASINRTQE